MPILFSAQKISGVQLFNSQPNDETPVIKFGEQLILNFDDLNNSLVFRTVGDNVIRKKLVHFFEELRLNQFTVIDKSANVSKTAQIGYSTYIGKNTAINAQAKIGYGGS